MLEPDTPTERPCWMLPLEAEILTVSDEVLTHPPAGSE